MLSVLVVDDSPTARVLIAEILRTDDELKIAGEASSGDEAVRMTALLKMAALESLSDSDMVNNQ